MLAGDVRFVQCPDALSADGASSLGDAKNLLLPVNAYAVYLNPGVVWDQEPRVSSSISQPKNNSAERSETT